MCLEGHELELIAADGQPLEPLRGENIAIDTAERYDFLVTLKESGSFTLHAAALDSTKQAISVLYTRDAPSKPTLTRPLFSGRSIDSADYASLRSPYPTTLPKAPVNTFDIKLGGDMKNYL